MKELIPLWMAAIHIQAANDSLDEFKTSKYNVRELKQTTKNFKKAYKRHFEKLLVEVFNVEDETSVLTLF